MPATVTGTSQTKVMIWFQADPTIEVFVDTIGDLKKVANEKFDVDEEEQRWDFWGITEKEDISPRKKMEDYTYGQDYVVARLVENDRSDGRSEESLRNAAAVLRTGQRITSVLFREGRQVTPYVGTNAGTPLLRNSLDTSIGFVTSAEQTRSFYTLNPNFNGQIRLKFNQAVLKMNESSSGQEMSIDELTNSQYCRLYSDVRPFVDSITGAAGSPPGSPPRSPPVSPPGSPTGSMDKEIELRGREKAIGRELNEVFAHVMFVEGMCLLSLRMKGGKLDDSVINWAEDKFTHPIPLPNPYGTNPIDKRYFFEDRTDNNDIWLQWKTAHGYNSPHHILIKEIGKVINGPFAIVSQEFSNNSELTLEGKLNRKVIKNMYCGVVKDALNSSEAHAYLHWGFYKK